jgi:F420-0:gamma-glutamyl ligase-like protein
VIAATFNTLGIYALALGYTAGEIVQATGLAFILPRKTRKMMSMNPLEPDPLTSSSPV